MLDTDESWVAEGTVRIPLLGDVAQAGRSRCFPSRRIWMFQSLCGTGEESSPYALAPVDDRRGYSRR